MNSHDPPSDPLRPLKRTRPRISRRPPRWVFTDDDGGAFPLWKPVLDAMTNTPVARAMSPETYRSVRRSIGYLGGAIAFGRGTGIVLLVVVSLDSVVGIGYWIFAGFPTPDASDLLIGVARLAIVSLLALGTWWSLGENPKHLLRALRVHDRCGCAYDLSGLEPDDDGLITCPECGARWRRGSTTTKAR